VQNITRSRFRGRRAGGVSPTRKVVVIDPVRSQEVGNDLDIGVAVTDDGTKVVTLSTRLRASTRESARNSVRISRVQVTNGRANRTTLTPTGMTTYGCARRRHVTGRYSGVTTGRGRSRPTDEGEKGSGTFRTG